MNAISTPASHTPIGLVAGWGRYPILVAQALKRLGYPVFCAGIKSHADPALCEICDGFRWFGVGKFGGQLRYFRRRQVHHAMLAGKIFKSKIFFHGLGWMKHLPDWQCFCTFFHNWITKKKDMRDDTLLSSVVNLAMKSGIHIAPATDFAPELLVKAGTLTKRRVTQLEWKDIEYGWQLAHEMGRLDVGQSAAVKGRAALAVEAIEGTDECIRRAGRLCPQGRFVVVKVAKPNQDMRFDVPTIGLGTLKTMVDAGAHVLAIEAGKTIVLDEPLVVQFANCHGISVVAVKDARAEEVDNAA